MLNMKKMILMMAIFMATSMGLSQKAEARENCDSWSNWGGYGSCCGAGFGGGYVVCCITSSSPLDCNYTFYRTIDSQNPDEDFVFEEGRVKDESADEKVEQPFEEKTYNSPEEAEAAAMYELKMYIAEIANQDRK